MDSVLLRKRLKHSGHAIASLLERVDAAEAAWKPEPDRWSLTEVVCHLLDEEREDFRARLRVLVEEPDGDFARIDPLAWVESRRYAERDYGDSVATWKEERGASLQWLAHAPKIDPEARLSGERSGPDALRAGDLMLSWLSHDYFHIRQITTRRWEYLACTEKPYSPDYAGPLE